MPVTQSDIDNLNAAIASAEKQVALGSQQVTYRSIAELISARDDLRADAGGGVERPEERREQRVLRVCRRR